VNGGVSGPPHAIHRSCAQVTFAVSGIDLSSSRLAGTRTVHSAAFGNLGLGMVNGRKK